MSAYVIVDIDIHDAAQYEAYKKLAPASLAVYGGQYIARGGKTEVLEGSWQPKRVVILQFEDAGKAKAWLNSEEYREARALRHHTATTNMVVVDGI